MESGTYFSVYLMSHHFIFIIYYYADLYFNEKRTRGGVQKGKTFNYLKMFYNMGCFQSFLLYLIMHYYTSKCVHLTWASIK